MDQLGYSSDESDSYSENEDLLGSTTTTANIKPPPKELTLKFSKAPIYQHKTNHQHNNDSKNFERNGNEPKKVVFVYLSTTPPSPSANQLQKFKNLTEKVLFDLSSQLRNFSSYLEVDQDYLLEDPLTKAVKELHVSLSFNMSVSPSQYDQLISTVSLELGHLQSGQKCSFPAIVKFSGIRLLLSQDSKKIFVCLMIQRDGVGENIVKIISSFNNFIDGNLEQHQTYDSEFMHCSIGQLLTNLFLMVCLSQMEES
ncbi:unnamed protein product [Ambrosiozyma monospora]|uniref:Unnamed protein product n=1 Tax=Ambrosiozyma monospora TaxID=43982 RepID=A0ACB5TWJ1_AMBMO|nr:unnamed protein product [Ambrosiozyma monospora]